MLHDRSSSKIFGNDSEVCDYENNRKELQHLLQEDLSKNDELILHRKNYKNQIYELKKMLKDILKEKKTKISVLDAASSSSRMLTSISPSTSITTSTPQSPSCPSSSSHQSSSSQNHLNDANSIFADVLLCVGSELYRDKNNLMEEERLLINDIKKHRREVRTFTNLCMHLFS